MNKIINNKVIIWGPDDFNTLGLLRQLGSAGIDIFFLIKGKEGYASKSIYCTKLKTTSTFDEGLSFLLSTYTDETAKPIIITSGDGIAVFIDQHKIELEKVFIIPGTTIQGLEEKYTDKNAMTELAVKIGILCPQSRYVQWNSDISSIQYPCLIKPSHQKPGHFNEFKFKICNDKDSLKRILKFVRHDSEFIVQDFIKKEKDILVYGARMWDGKTILAGAMIKDRFADCGSSSHGLMTYKIPSCVAQHKIIEFLDKIDYHGLFSFEYGMMKDKAYFFEVNLRNDGTSHYFWQTGANIPLAYIYSSAGLDYSCINTKVTEEKWFIDEFFDIENVIHGRFFYSQWKKDKSEATVFKYYDKNDLEPWKFVKRTMWQHLFRDILLKKYRVYIIFILDKFGLKK